QPSTEMQLMFYSLFKQATIGQCNVSRPAFYDIVGRTKWDAWNHLKETSKDQAMQMYVNELKKV
ncbi:hypothetical protein HELRODRAFT_138932, partial [Helobdella robusta]|uniref:ACB domain-containing protein n=1 Tax=Helobdella robusta TaxID=6412 RepID=T1EIY2_HELRO